MFNFISIAGCFSHLLGLGELDEHTQIHGWMKSSECVREHEIFVFCTLSRFWMLALFRVYEIKENPTLDS